MNPTGVSVRVQRTAGEAAETLRRLNDMAVAARKGLDGVDDALERLHRNRDAVQQQLAGLGRPTLRADVTRAENLRATLDALNREITEVERRRQEAPQGGQTVLPPTPGTPGARRALTPEERQRLVGTGNYTERELARATWLRPPTMPGDVSTGTVFVPPMRADVPRATPPSRPAPPDERPDSASSSSPGDSRGMPGTGDGATLPPAERRAEGERRRSPDREARTEEARRVDETADEYRDLAASTRLTALSSRELRYEWQQNVLELRAQGREIDRTVTELDRLQAKKKTAKRDDEIERLVERRRDLQVGRTSLEGERDRLRQELESRGFRVGSGGILLGPERQGPAGLIGSQRPTARQLMGTLAAGAGFGGGSPGGVAINAALGWLNPWTAAATAVGMAGGYMFSDGGRANQLRRLVFDAGMRGGGGFQGIYDDALGGMSAPYFLRPEESIEARMALGTQTGRTDVRGIAAFARAYGLPPGSVAAMIGRVGTLGALPRGSDYASKTPRLTMAPATRPPKLIDLPPLGHYADPTKLRDTIGPGGEEWGFGAARMRIPAGDSLVAAAAERQARSPEGLVARTFWEHAAAGMVAPGQAVNIAPYRAAVIAQGTPLPVAERRGPQRPDAPEPAATGGIAPILAGAYRSSAYRGLPGDRQDLLMQSFLQQWSRLSHVQQAAGGMPIQNWETVPAMLSTATRYFGKDISPEIPAARVGAFMEGFQNPKGAVLRGIQLRGIREMAEGMTPEQLAEFKRATGGIDLETHAGRIEAMQRAFALPEKQKIALVKAQARAREQVVGSNTQSAQFMIAEAHTNGQMGPAREIMELQNKLLYARPGSAEETDITRKIEQKMNASGDFGQLFRNDLLEDKAVIDATEGIKALGQSIRGSVLQLTNDVMEALDTWNSGVGVQPGVRSE